MIDIEQAIRTTIDNLRKTGPGYYASGDEHSGWERALDRVEDDLLSNLETVFRSQDDNSMGPAITARRPTRTSVLDHFALPCGTD